MTHSLYAEMTSASTLCGLHGLNVIQCQKMVIMQ